MLGSVEATKLNCFGCGRAIVQVEALAQHQPRPDDAESDRCPSRPRKYSALRCRLAEGHQCVHSARVSGTGIHYWRDNLAA